MSRKKRGSKRWLSTMLTAIIVLSVFTAGIGIVPVSAAPIVERSINPDMVSPGEVVDVTIEFTTTDENIFLGLRDGIPTGWTVTDITANIELRRSGVDPETGEVYFVWVSVPAFSSGTDIKAEYKLHVPDGEDPDEYTLDGTLHRSAVPHDVTITGKDTIEVKLPHGVDLIVDDSTKTTDADVNATYLITVENTGANEDTYDLSVTVPSGADLEVLSEDSVTIPGGGSEVVELNVASFFAGDYVTTVEASSVHVSDDITVTTTVSAFHGVDLVVTPEERTVAPDEDAVYILTVTNLGNDADTINLAIITNEADSGELSEATFSLSAGASDTADLTVRDSNVGIYDTTVRATSQKDVTKWVTKTVTTNVTEVADTTSPAAITDLDTSNPTSSTIDLTWTAPGDDDTTGQATTYDIRYSTSEITEGNWDSAEQCTGEPAPQVAGTSETFTVTGLLSSTTYYFALKTEDEVPNESPLSNVESGMTKPSVTKGDVNNDGVINTGDVTYLARYLAEWPGYTTTTEAADVNDDGVINTGDVTYLARYLAEWPGYTL